MVEAANTDESLIALKTPTLSIDVIVCDIAAIGARSGFELSQLGQAKSARTRGLVAGTLSARSAPRRSCARAGPHLARRYEPEAVVDYIKRSRAAAA